MIHSNPLLLHDTFEVIKKQEKPVESDVKKNKII